MNSLGQSAETLINATVQWYDYSLPFDKVESALADEVGFVAYDLHTASTTGFGLCATLLLLGSCTLVVLAKLL